MENYIVSARKYRPLTFETVVGQPALTTTLKNAIATGKLAHAYLFCGPRGVGKTTCARIFAKTINCQNLTAKGEACNVCESCRAFMEQRSYNIHELDAASNNSVDDIRQLVEQVRIPPQIGRYKVYIIDEVHMLSAAAFNAFLKTLEEPPRHAIFILATTEKHKIIPTILSRCQIYDFNRISVEDMVAHLAYVASKEGIPAEPEALNVIALKADGGLRDALSIFDQVVSFTGGRISYREVIENLNVLDYDYYFRLTDAFLENRVSDALLLLNEVLNSGFDAGEFITGLASHLRDLLVSKDPATLPLLEVGATIRERYKKQGAQCPLSFLYRAIKLCNNCDLNYRASKNKRLLVELTLIETAQLTLDNTNREGGESPKPHLKSITTPAGNAAAGQTVSQLAQTTAQPTVTSPVQSKISPKSSSVLKKIEEASAPTIPRVKQADLGISIKGISAKEQSAASSDSISSAPSEESTPTMNEDVTEVELNRCWQEYVKAMPQAQVAMAKRMKGMKLHLKEDDKFEIIVENEQKKKEFTALASSIENYLQKQLKNSLLKMQIEIAPQKTSVHAYNRQEKFQLMNKKNEAMSLLKDRFELEFD